MNKTLSPPAKPSRVSVPISPEALAAFERLAKAGNMSTGKAIATWLDDTIDAIEYTALTMERARSAPKQVMAEMHAYALGLADETGAMLDKIRAKGKGAAQGAGACDSAERGAAPPSCNTGGKVPTGKSQQRGGKSS